MAPKTAMFETYAKRAFYLASGIFGDWFITAHYLQTVDACHRSQPTCTYCTVLVVRMYKEKTRPAERDMKPPPMSIACHVVAMQQSNLHSDASARYLSCRHHEKSKSE